MAATVPDHTHEGLGSTDENARVWKANYSTANSNHHHAAHPASSMPSSDSHARHVRASSPHSSTSSLLSEIDVDALSDIRSVNIDSDEDMDDVGYDDVDGGDGDEALGMDSSAMDISGNEDDEHDNSHTNELALQNSVDGVIDSFGSSYSDISDISSVPSDISSKATTPVDAEGAEDHREEEEEDDGDDDAESREDVAQTPTTTYRPSYHHDIDRLAFNVRAKSSIPTDIPSQQYASECIWAAETSRLNPYALHPEEYLLFRHHISHAQVTTYLNIRNGILRLWLKNPRTGVTRKAAIGCANARWFDAASVCYDWLLRRGHINFGCVNVPSSGRSFSGEPPAKKAKTVAVIGAGFSGLSCARQLECLFKQYADRFHDRGEEPPRVVVLEGRSRVGGRVYSRELKTRPEQNNPAFANKRHTAEMGGMIITGFDRGNPVNVLVRAQLGLSYRALTPDTTIYDSNGEAVDIDRDQQAEQLYNDCLDRVSEFKHLSQPSKLIEGNSDLIEEGRDSPGDGSRTIMQAEKAAAALPHALPISKQSVPDKVNMVPVSSDRVTGRVHMEPGVAATLKASEKVKMMGWKLKAGSLENDSIDLTAAAQKDDATLGSVLDHTITQYQNFVDLSPLDLRLLNWHIANLEYSNAISLRLLSLPLWDIDAGNEWEGAHTMVVGGYQSVARGLLQCPTPLDIRMQHPVKSINYNSADPQEGYATIVCEDGTVVEADSVVCTIPLGVLKRSPIKFEPPLPSWKQGVIDRLGFGTLNKVVLVYNKVFWEADRDIFGVLRDAPCRRSTVQQEYEYHRGRFFQWFNVTHTTGLPCLVALMAGNAGVDTEFTDNYTLVSEATSVLRGIFGKDVPYPVEAVVTRWGSDRFARGSYSSAAPGMKPDDYDTMARPIGNLFFAGEHTIGTHPATVHGAYLSGLRAASEVLEEMLGPIEVPTPLVLPKDSLLLHKRNQSALDPRRARLESYELDVWAHIRSKIGERPVPPPRGAVTAFSLYSRQHYDEVKAKCETNRKPGKNRSIGNEVRMKLAKMWKATSPDEREPFEEQIAESKRLHAEAMQRHNRVCEKWDQEASELRSAYEKENPSVPGPEELDSENCTPNKFRRAKPVSYAES